MIAFQIFQISIDSTATTVAGGDPQAWARRRKRRFNKHKQNRKSNKGHGPNSSRTMTDEIVPEEPLCREIEIRLMPLDRDMIKKVKAQGIKVNLTRPKKKPRKYIPKKESPWQLSRHETFEGSI